MSKIRGFMIIKNTSTTMIIFTITGVARNTKVSATVELVPYTTKPIIV